MGRMTDREILKVVEDYWDKLRAQSDRGLTSPAFAQIGCYRAIVEAAQAELRRRVEELTIEKDSIVRTAVDAIGGSWCKRHEAEVGTEPFDVFYAKHVAEGCHRCLVEQRDAALAELAKIRGGAK